MARKGLLIDYEYCSGCQACEVACKQEHDYPVGRGGIALQQIDVTLPNGRLRTDFIPFTTAYCDGCAARVHRGEAPACVKHCQAQTMFYGTLDEMAKLMEDKPNAVLFTI
jgi:Fe-S-cluster-containing dehydrogenase component